MSNKDVYRSKRKGEKQTKRSVEMSFSVKMFILESVENKVFHTLRKISVGHTYYKSDVDSKETNW